MQRGYLSSQPARVYYVFITCGAAQKPDRGGTRTTKPLRRKMYIIGFVQKSNINQLINPTRIKSKEELLYKLNAFFNLYNYSVSVPSSDSSIIEMVHTNMPIMIMLEGSEYCLFMSTEKVIPDYIDEAVNDTQIPDFKNYE